MRIGAIHPRVPVSLRSRANTKMEGQADDFPQSLTPHGRTAAPRPVRIRIFFFWIIINVTTTDISYGGGIAAVGGPGRRRRRRWWRRR